MTFKNINILDFTNLFKDPNWKDKIKGIRKKLDEIDDNPPKEEAVQNKSPDCVRRVVYSEEGNITIINIWYDKGFSEERTKSYDYPIS